MKRISALFIAILLVINIPNITFANEVKPDISIEILSPDHIHDYPGREETVKAKVTNNSSKELHEVLVYITMADIKKNMTVNLEDYSADKPVYIESIKAGESRIVELPIRFVYTSKYYLYTTVVTKESNTIISSNAIPIEILGNTKINKSLANGVAVLEPIVLLVLVGVIYGYRRKKYQVK